MLAIRLQRIGRSGHAQFRLIVQDKRFSPKSGRVTAYLGSYDPHTKTAELDKEKAAQYLKNGAHPSERAAKLLKSEGVKLPAWVKIEKSKKKRAIRNPEKLRRNRPAEAEAPSTAEAATDEVKAEETVAEEQPAAEAEPQADEKPAEEAPAAEEPKPEA